jgi:GntR family transcriptional repressor for pyruvate dehydrogenase complex
MTTFKPVSSIPLADAIADQVKEMILNGTFKPGDRLPTENELMHQFNVGRSTVREALKSLAMAGLVESRRTSGTFVTTSYRGFLNDKVRWTALLNEREILNITQVRLALEGHAAMLAAERATPEEKTKIEELIQELELHLNEPDEAARIDLDFHVAIAEASHNKLLLTLVLSLRNLIHDFLKLGYVRRRTSDIILKEHRRLFAAIQAGDAETAEQAMRAHLTRSAAWMVKYARNTTE